MLAALGTLVFLATLWLVVVVSAAILEDDGSRIAAALKGRSASRLPLRSSPARIRPRAYLRRPMRAQPRLHAAA